MSMYCHTSCMVGIAKDANYYDSDGDLSYTHMFSIPFSKATMTL